MEVVRLLRHVGDNIGTTVVLLHKLVERAAWGRH